MKKHYHISLGPSFDYFYLGVFIFGLGVWLGAMTHPTGWLLCPIGILVFLSRKAIDFDTVGMRRKLYYDFLFFHLGGWIPYSKDDEIWLVKSTDYRDTTSFNQGSIARYGSSGYVYYFKIILSTDQGDMELDTFQEYTKALDCLDRYSTALNLKAVNDFDNKLNEAQSKPRR